MLDESSAVRRYLVGNDTNSTVNTTSTTTTTVTNTTTTPVNVSANSSNLTDMQILDNQIMSELTQLVTDGHDGTMNRSLCMDNVKLKTHTERNIRCHTDCAQKCNDIVNTN